MVLPNRFEVAHTYNEQQVEWFKAGGALNIIKAAIGK
jgi:aconitate hydratase